MTTDAVLNLIRDDFEAQLLDEAALADAACEWEVAVELRRVFGVTLEPEDLKP